MIWFVIGEMEKMVCFFTGITFSNPGAFFDLGWIRTAPNSLVPAGQAQPIDVGVMGRKRSGSLFFLLLIGLCLGGLVVSSLFQGAISVIPMIAESAEPGDFVEPAEWEEALLAKILKQEIATLAAQRNSVLDYGRLCSALCVPQTPPPII